MLHLQPVVSPLLGDHHIDANLVQTRDGHSTLQLRTQAPVIFLAQPHETAHDVEPSLLFPINPRSVCKTLDLGADTIIGPCKPNA